VTPDRWQEIQALFQAAAELAPAARGAYLAEACAGDEVLRREVLALLDAERRSSDEHLISDVVALAARALAGAAGESWAGRQLGPYRLLRELGRGGMGTVYLAERVDEHYRAQVAIKFVRAGPATPELARRFLIERQILADLTHPHIAWLLDGGTAPDGTPYLVMEYVDGQPIDAWCETHGLGLDGRLALFERVCSAVQYAHQALVVHRDLKPSNILVARDGTPKLVDFGIAKLLADDEAAETTATLRLLTPAYAAPEQVRGGRIGVATDVYGLGGVLYRLVTGRTPIDLDGATPADVERRICETEPLAPSAAAAEPAAAWRRALRGDLDTIVLKALRKEPERRYASVEQLAGDLRRYGAGLPVSARPDTMGYRSRKFLRRHRIGVLFTAALATLTAAYTLQVARERDRARIEAQRATRVSEFLERLFTVSNPRESRNRDVTARELLERGAARVDRELAAEPAAQTALMRVIGRVYYNLGYFDEAVRQLDRTLTLRRDMHRGVHPDVAQSETDLADALYNAGALGPAETHFREALRMQHALHAGDHPDVLATLEGLAAFLSRTERLDEAARHYRDALAMRQRLGPDSGSLASLSDGLASTLMRQGDYAGAEPLFRRAVALVRQRQPLDSLILSVAIHNLAGVLVDLGQLDEASRLQREALEITIAFYGPDHPVVSSGRLGLGRLLRQRGDLTGAEEQFRRALAIDSVRLGATHPDMGTNLGQLGTTLLAQGRYAEAETALRRALAIRRQALGAEHPYVAISLNELAGLFYARRQWSLAEGQYRQALALRRRVHPPEHPYIAYSLVGLAKTLLAERRSADAEPLLREAAQIRGKALPEGHMLRREVDSLLALAAVP
jgi:serine/threonine-protein kinase